MSRSTSKPTATLDAMEAPYTIASLPRPLDANHGKIQAAPVYGLHGSRKRKRHEVVAGVDGESVNIYNIQTQGLLASYAIPPQAYLCCPPSSCHSRPADSNVSRRDTFVILRDGAKDGKRRLVRFSEKTSASGEFATPVKFDYKLPKGDVLAVEALSSSLLGENQAPSAIVTYTNGENLCVSEDMSDTVWTHSFQDEEDADTIIEYVNVLELSQARKGLLGSRQDILDALNSSTSSSTMLACFVIRQRAKNFLRLCSLDTAIGRAGLRRLDDLQLSDSGTTTLESSRWELSAASGQLNQLKEGVVYSHDLSGIVPRLILTLKDRNAPITSAISLPSASLLTIAGTQATVYESKYGSIQATVSLHDASNFDVTGKKRKRGEDRIGTSEVQLLSAFADIGIVVALSNDFIGLQLKEELHGSKRNARGVRLSSVFGKGVLENVGSLLIGDDLSDRRQRRWQKWCSHVDNLLATDNIIELENYIAQNLDIVIEAGKEELQPNGTSESHQNGHNGDETTLWSLEAGPHDLNPYHRRKALYLLSKMFGLSTQTSEPLRTSSPLQVQFRSRNLARWLTVTDILSAANLTRIFSRTITPKDLAQAVGGADTTFHLLHDILSLPIHLPLAFTIETLRLLINSLDTPSSNTPPTETQSTTEDQDLDLESRTAELELTQALDALESGLELRSATMRLVLGRLHAFPRVTLTTHLRDGLAQRDLVFFIHVLRIELADAGWTERYVDAGADAFREAGMLAPGQAGAQSQSIIAPREQTGLQDEESGPSDRAIRTIGNLLVASVDAIGAAGWLVGLSGDEMRGDELLDALRAEVSASLEGVFEAHALSGYLGEFERYAVRAEQQAGATERIHRHGIGANGVVFDSESAMMPVGGRVEALVASGLDGKKGRQGKKGKTGVELIRARERVRPVGEYEFERIRI